MLAWFSWPQIFASSMNISMKSASSAIDGRMRLMARIFSKPSTPKDLALNTSAMPPTLIRSSKTYLPNGIGCRKRFLPRAPAHGREHLIVSPQVKTHQANSWAPSPGRRTAIAYALHGGDGRHECLHWPGGSRPGGGSLRARGALRSDDRA